MSYAYDIKIVNIINRRKFGGSDVKVFFVYHTEEGLDSRFRLVGQRLGYVAIVKQLVLPSKKASLTMIEGRFTTVKQLVLLL